LLAAITAWHIYPLLFITGVSKMFGFAFTAGLSYPGTCCALVSIAVIMTNIAVTVTSAGGRHN